MTCAFVRTCKESLHKQISHSIKDTLCRHAKKADNVALLQPAASLTLHSTKEISHSMVTMVRGLVVFLQQSLWEQKHGLIWYWMQHSGHLQLSNVFWGVPLWHTGWIDFGLSFPRPWRHFPLGSNFFRFCSMLILNQLSSLLGLWCEASKLWLRCQLPQLHMGKVLYKFAFNSIYLLDLSFHIIARTCVCWISHSILSLAGHQS